MAHRNGMYEEAQSRKDRKKEPKTNAVAKIKRVKTDLMSGQTEGKGKNKTKKQTN